MNRTKKTLTEEVLPNLVVLLLGGVVISLIFGIKNHLEKDIAECTQPDLYNLQEMTWGQCIDGVQKRDAIKIDNPSCNNPGAVTAPDLRRDCRVCEESDLLISNWGICDSQGIQKRTITKIDSSFICEIQISDTQPCSFSEKSRVILLDNYKTQAGPDWENPYESNNGNILLKSNGRFKSAKLTISAKTTVLGGETIRRPEYYYFMFALGDSPKRILDAVRVKDNRLDLNSPGVFSGMDTPATISFDLESLGLATKTPEEGGITYENVMEKLNSEEGKEISMTLHMGDGRSMVHEDEKLRIFGVIEKAIIEYECEEGSPCSLEAIQSFEIEN